MTSASDPATTRPRVLVIEPDERIRETLSRLLRIGGRVIVVGSAGDRESAVELFPSCPADVALLDARIAAGDGETICVELLRAAMPGLRVVVLGWSATGESAGQGAADIYLRKTFRPHELIDAVVRAAQTADPLRGR
jgi:DNA-binding NarL/FixJ family response regulator